MSRKETAKTVSSADKRKRGRTRTKRLVLSAMLCAMSIVVGILCKNFLNFGNGLFRITFESTPVILCGLLFGPVYGALCGAIADVTSYCISVQGFAISPLVTVAAALYGLIAGIMAMLVKERSARQVISACSFAHIISSFILKPIALYPFYGWLVLWRIPFYLLIVPAEIVILILLFRNKTFCRLIEQEPLVLYQDDESKLTYDEALTYIHTIRWEFCKPGLERTRELCEKLGNPQKKLKFIHVAGTNGKGSFCAMTASVLQAAGYKVGLYTSPYIRRFNERMMINGEPISDAELAKITAEVKIAADGMKEKPTEFELITGLAFLWFARKKVDVVVLEVGMGGRLDSTNVIESPLLSVITGISLDHTAFLGKTIPEIAEQKAGIIKKNRPILWCGNDESAEEVIRAKAEKMSAPFAKPDLAKLIPTSMTLDGTVFDYEDMKNVRLPLLGLYQPENCGNVLAALELLRESGNGFAVTEKDIRRGLANVSWPARFEILVKEPTVIYDGGHNPQGVDAAVAAIRHYFAEKKLIFVTGVMKDKDYRYIAERISGVAAEVFTVTPQNPRSLTAAEYADVYRSFGVKATPADTVKEAITAAVARAKEDSTAVFCLGSLYLYEELSASLSSLSD